MFRDDDHSFAYFEILSEISRMYRILIFIIGKFTFKTYNQFVSFLNTIYKLLHIEPFCAPPDNW